MLPFLWSLLALLLGPLLVWVARRQAATTVSLDAFCLVTVSGFALLHLLPESAAQAGWLVLPLALAGFLLPAIAERTLHHGHAGMRKTVLLLALLGITAHATLDGLLLVGDGHVALHEGHADTHTHELTAWAIVLHRIPEGIGIWWIVPRTLGTWAALVITAVSVLATSFGFGLGETLLDDQSQRGLAMLQSLLVGSLLHVVLHAHVPAPREQGRFRIASVLGGALGVAVLAVLIHDHFPASEQGSPAHVFVQLAIESAPALLLAYLLVGLCHAFLPGNWLRSMTRGSALGQALRGVAIGLPLPVCSCGVLPIYRELIQQGTALAAALAFLVATPELELAAVLLTWRLMGPEVAIVRVLMAAALALGVGVLVGGLVGKRDRAVPAPEGTPDKLPTSTPTPLGARLREALRFGFGPAVDNTATWILTGLLLSAMLVPYVERDVLLALPRGLDVPVAALLGLPLYVCATGSTPLVAMLLAQGLSPGAGLALLLTGPATNVTTFAVLGRLHGKTVALAFAGAMWLGAVALGYLANALLSAPQLAGFEPHEHAVSWWSWTLLTALGVVFLFALLRQGVRPFLERLFESPANVAPDEPPGCCAHGPDDGHGHHGHDHPHDHDHAVHHQGRALTPASAFTAVAPSPAPLAPPRPPAENDGGCCGHRH